MLVKNSPPQVKRENKFDEAHFKFHNLCNRLLLLKIIRNRGDDFFIKNVLRIHETSNEIAKFERDESIAARDHNAAQPFELFSPGYKTKVAER